MPQEVFERAVPKLPDANSRIRLLIDSDAKNEVDDQYAITLALLSPERFRIEGLVASCFGPRPGSIQESYDEIIKIMALAGMAGKYPVKMGSHPMQYESVPTESEGVDFIIERAMAGSSEDPLWIVAIGGCTDLSSAYVKCPEIADKVVIFWHGRCMFWPERCANANFGRDPRAAQVLFHSNMPFVLFDTGTFLTLPMEESATRLRPLGELGRYLHDIRNNSPRYTYPTKGFFDLGDIAALADPTLVYCEETNVPDLIWNGHFSWTKTYGKLLRICQIDRERTWDLFLGKMHRWAEGRG